MNAPPDLFAEFIRNKLELYRAAGDRPGEVCEQKPEHIYIEPTNHCNLKCRHCTHPMMTRPQGLMEDDLYRRLIDDIVATRFGWRITLVGQGEPLLHPRLPEMVAYAKQRGELNVSLITNATRLTPALGDRLIDAGLDRIQFSCESLDAAAYESFRRGANYRATMANILRFLARNQERQGGVFTSVTIVASRFNASAIDAMREYWQRLPVDNVYVAPLSTLQGKSELAGEVVLPEAERGRFCLIPWTVFNVKVDGAVTACPHDYDNRYVVGSVRERSLAELWNSEPMRRIRRASLNQDWDEFTALGHDCRACNSPLVRTSPEYYRENLVRDLIYWTAVRGKKPGAGGATAHRERNENLRRQLAELNL